jgi:hypothetical protein
MNNPSIGPESGIHFGIDPMLNLLIGASLGAEPEVRVSETGFCFAARCAGNRNDGGSIRRHPCRGEAFARLDLPITVLN